MAMDVHLGRVVFENPEAANLEIVIDLVLEGRKAKAGLVYFGVWLDKEAEVTCPFVLDPNGQADFGTSYDGQDRYYETNLNSIELGVGQEILWRSGDLEQTFKVTGITQLV
jgi:hypothetical protein